MYSKFFYVSPVATYFPVVMRKLWDETYSVISEVIMRKFRASMEPFCDLEISKYVEYLMCLSSEYHTSSVLPSVTSITGQTCHVILTYVIPWINKASYQ